MSFMAGIEARAVLMGRMVDRLGIDIEGAVLQGFGTSVGQAARTCCFCRSASVCRRWLDDAEAAGSYRDFCPNAARFDRMPKL